MDLLKAETLRVMLKLLMQVASVDPLLLYGNRDTGVIDSSILTRCLNYYMMLANADYQVEETIGRGPASEQVARDAQEIALKLFNCTLRRIFPQNNVEPELIDG